MLATLTATTKFDRLIDPFLGGGSTLHTFQGVPFLAADSNGDLIEFHRVCATRPADLHRAVTAIPDDSDTYYRVRASSPRSAFERATRFLYLNRTAYGGIYRVNAAGVFNVPYGGGGRLGVGHLLESLENHAAVLRDGVLTAQDFRATLERVKASDLLFVDPPYYSPGHATFNRYASRAFGIDDREDLTSTIRVLADGGVSVIATLPSDAELLRQLAGWRLISTLSSTAMPRGEMLVVSPSFGRSVGGQVVPASPNRVRDLLVAAVPDINLSR